VGEFLYFMSGRLLVAPLRRGGRILRAKARYWSGKAANFLARLKQELSEALPIALIICAVFLLTLFVPLPPLLRIVLGAVTCGAVIPVFYAFSRERDLTAFQQRERSLDGVCQTDGAPYDAAVFLRKAAFSDRENFLNEFRSVPAGAKSVVLVLLQTRKESWYGSAPYTVESMKRQLQRRNDDPYASKIDVRWVCIENKYNTFEAYMGYSRFAADILYCENPAYADLLNTGDVDKFRRKLQDHKDGEDGLKKACVARPNVIAGLCGRFLPTWVTRRQVISKLIAEGHSEVMLVSDDCKRLGIVTLNSLLQRTFLSFLFTPGDLQALDRKIEGWREECRRRVAELEAAEIPPPPAETGDDRPDYDSMVPTDGLRRRGAGLRFRRP